MTELQVQAANLARPNTTSARRRRHLALARVAIFGMLVMCTHQASLAEPPPYGPSTDTWGGCVDNLPNVDGIIGVICPALIPVKTSPAAELVKRARAACMTMRNASFDRRRGAYFCSYQKTAVPKTGAVR